ncbi:MAG TPA: DUF4012 domain-containing protein [Candidatus Sulfotelmatobacter sp.]|nr:DUF4012 domain-containing protein [Candidatus Sulfotelmatobacter sp.]
MNHTAIVSSENKDYPILIVDKKGDIGQALAERLKNESLVVFASKNYEGTDENIVHIPYFKKIPSVPDNTYSHIFLIDESSEVTNDLISPFLKKAEKDNAIFLLCVNKNYLKEKTVNKLLNTYEKAKVAILGDIFSKDKIYNSKNDINDFIADIKKSGKIVIPGDGTREIYPVFFEDAVDSILEAVFGDYEKEKVFLIFSNKAASLLKIASIFKKIIPSINIDYLKEKKKKINLAFAIEGRHLISENYNLEEKIKKINFEEPSFLIKSDYKNEANGRNLIDYFLFLLSFAISILVIPAIFALIASLIGLTMLFSIKQEVNSENTLILKSKALIASQSFLFAKDSIALLNKEASFLGKENLVLGFSEKISQGADASSLVLSTVDSYEKAKNIINGVSKDPKSDFSYVYAESKKAYYSYEKLLQEGLIPKFLSDKFSEPIKIYSSTVDFWKEILGFNGKKTYLVLFQNNMELRPGGGFIGSYAIASIENGNFLSFKIYDAYDADGQLRAHVEPPFAIRRYLPSVHWYLRDSNFNVDYSKGAVASAIFLNSEMHQSVDGVISVDLSFIKSLLSILGPVNVSDYNEKITSDNFFQVTEKHAEKDFFPGSTQKKDFLKSFYNSLILKLTENKSIQYIPLISAFANSIYEKHVLFAFNKQNMQTAFSLNRYSSALVDNREINDSRINDFIGINEANLGVDKVNYFITRSLSHTVLISDSGEIRENALIAIKNSADEKVWTGAGYKNYLRIILPIGANITSIKIDNINQNIVSAVEDPSIYEKKNFLPPKGLEVEKYNQDKNTIYGFLVNVGPKELKTVSVEYTLAQKIDVQKPEFTYDLKVFKQPGIDFLPYEFSINYPKNIKPVNISNDIKTTTTRALFSAQLTTDEEITIDFGQK